jgi:hypothetical protein
MRFNPLRGRRPSPAMIVAMLALIAALAGTATAASLIKSKDIKNGTIRGKDIHKKTIPASKLTKAARNSLKGQRGPQGAKGNTGAKGSALGFATVTFSGGNAQIDETHSSAGITDAMVSKSGNAVCFNGLPFTPKLAVGNVDLNFAVGNTLQTNAGAVGGNGGCPGNEQASAVEVNSTGATVNPVVFYIAFY